MIFENELFSLKKFGFEISEDIEVFIIVIYILVIFLWYLVWKIKIAL